MTGRDKPETVLNAGPWFMGVQLGKGTTGARGHALSMASGERRRGRFAAVLELPRSFVVVAGPVGGRGADRPDKANREGKHRAAPPRKGLGTGRGSRGA